MPPTQKTIKIFVVFADEDRDRVLALLATIPANLNFIFILDHDITKIADCNAVIHIQSGISYERMSHELHLSQTAQKPIMPASNLDLNSLNVQEFWQEVTKTILSLHEFSIEFGSGGEDKPEPHEELKPDHVAKPLPTPTPPPSVVSPPAPPLPRPTAPITKPTIDVDDFDDEDEAGTDFGLTDQLLSEKKSEEKPQPTPAQGSSRAREIISSDAVDFTAFYPPRVTPQTQGALMVFTHLPSEYDAVKKVALSYDALISKNPTEAHTSANAPIKLGNPITFVVRVNGLNIAKGEQTIIWQPPYQLVTFLFSVSPDAPSVMSGQILVFDGALVIGEIPISITLSMPLSDASSSEMNNPAIKNESTLKKFESVFASYSHRDTPVMEYFRRLRQQTGHKMLVDVYDLRAGDVWNKRLLEMIEESQVFQLFWSPASAMSPYCKQEWQHALQLLPQRPRFIQPVWWGKEITPPPSELEALHFQKVDLPPMTWLQLSLSRARGFFKNLRK